MSNARELSQLANATLGFKNRLINAQGLINQRGYVSGTATSGANQYTVDRWRVVTSGQNLTFSTSGNVTTFTAPAGGVEQVIEGLNLETGTYVLSWTGTATATVGGTSVSNGGTVSVIGGTNTTVRFTGGTFSLPQFEKGTVATEFDYRSLGQELRLCQRYFEKSYNQSVVPGTAVNGSTCVPGFSILAQANPYLGSMVYFKVVKRSAPGIAVWDNAGNSGKITTNVGNNQAPGYDYVSDLGFRLYIGGTSHYLVEANWIADSEIY